MTRSLLLLLATTVVSHDALAAELVQPDLAITDVNLVDGDYRLQGEYAGPLFTGQGLTGWEEMGVQVVALGGGQFSGVLYRGGLPGRGWDQVEKYQVAGQRYGEILEMVGQHVRVVVEAGYAIVWVKRRQLGSFLPRVLRVSRTMHAEPPAGARVLFNGSDALQFANGQMTADGLLMEGADTLDSFGDFTMHLEFRLPYMPYARGQGRANSGVYLQSRYEVQILDSFGLEGESNECGGLYRQRPPDLNMCLPPLVWQTYDIILKSPRFLTDGSKLDNGRLSVWLNGVVIHDNVELLAKTGAGQPEGPLPLPTRLQDHGNPVRFRNIWLIEHNQLPVAYDTLPLPSSIPIAEPEISSSASTATSWPAARLNPVRPVGYWSGPSHSRIAFPGEQGAKGYVLPGS